uniref:Cap-specific mRNA (nucleoside-2'-O-)-methyltransferase 1 n=1 Tax=Myxobolus squamalis TaxID=59785 RepID=A0A6B2G0Q2_MYXSQ
MMGNENIHGCVYNLKTKFLSPKFEELIKVKQCEKKNDHEKLLVDESIFDVTNNLKSKLENYDPKEIYHSHNRMDYLKRTCRRIFLTRSLTNFNNRAGMKIAEVDFLIDFAITRASPVNHPLLYIKEDSILYFADLCCGSGSFTEYLLWKRNGWRAKGFCISLKDDLDIGLPIISQFKNQPQYRLNLYQLNQ